MILHPSYAGEGRGDMSGWSVSWNNRPRVRLAITADKDQPGQFELRMVKRNNGAQNVSLAWFRYDRGLLISAERHAEQAAIYDVVVSLAKQRCNGGIPFTRENGSVSTLDCHLIQEQCDIQTSRAQIRTYFPGAGLSDADLP
jgi:hypothetical protein